MSHPSGSDDGRAPLGRARAATTEQEYVLALNDLRLHRVAVKLGFGTPLSLTVRLVIVLLPAQLVFTFAAVHLLR
jgi:hypothetical protein